MKQINDRFSFDRLFRKLLNNGYTHEVALEVILSHFSLSTLVFQERVENGFYLKITREGEISSDLLALKNHIFNRILSGRNN